MGLGLLATRQCFGHCCLRTNRNVMHARSVLSSGSCSSATRSFHRSCRAYKDFPDSAGARASDSHESLFQAWATYSLIAVNVLVYGLYRNAVEVRRQEAQKLREKPTGIWRFLSLERRKEAKKPPEEPVNLWCFLPSVEFWQQHFTASWESVAHQGFVHTLLLSNFMHAEQNHLLLNMIPLFALGRLIEKMFGTYRFLVLYLSSGTIATFAQVAFCAHNEPDACCAGASGSLYALSSCFMLMDPFRVLHLSGKVFICLVFGVSTICMPDDTGHAAHLSGFLFGLVFCALSRRTLTHTSGS